MELWVVGRFVNMNDGRAWDFQGVFSNQEKAEAACRDETYFVGPAVLDQELTHDTVDWLGAYIPKLPNPGDRHRHEPRRTPQGDG